MRIPQRSHYLQNGVNPSIKRLLRNLDDFGNDELLERASNQLQKALDQTDTEESLLRIIEVA
jgi:hypothetical protein